MIRVLLFIFSMSFLICEGQNNYEKYGLKQENINSVEQIIKESLAIHMLLLKNNIDELNDFLLDYNYASDNDDSDYIWLTKIDFEQKKPDFSNTIRIHLNNKEDTQNYMEVYFLKPNFKNPFRYDKSIADDIYNSIIAQNLYECNEGEKCGTILNNGVKPLLDFLKTQSDIKDLIVDANKISWIENGVRNIKYISNFFDFNDIRGFSGPVDHLIMMKQKVIEMDDGSFFTIITIESPFAEKNLYTKDFNAKEFMAFSLKNRIWMKDKMK